MTGSRLDIFLDLSKSALTPQAATQYFAALASIEFAGNFGSFCTCVLPAGMATADVPPSVSKWRIWEHSQAVKAAEQSLYRAGLNGADWLVLRAPILAGPDQVGLLRDAFGLDPLFGYAMPRISDASGTRIEFLKPEMRSSYLSRRALVEL
ncbi:MAG TPA: hypothetical protein VF135_12655, partial [Terriglobales bacterium]